MSESYEQDPQAVTYAAALRPVGVTARSQASLDAATAHAGGVDLDRAEAALRGEPVTAAESEAGRQLANDRDWSDTWEPYKPLAADMTAGAADPPTTRSARSAPTQPLAVVRSPVQRALRHAQSRGQGRGVGR